MLHELFQEQEFFCGFDGDGPGFVLKVFESFNEVFGFDALDLDGVVRLTRPE
jgi:hypothetical protein